MPENGVHNEEQPREVITRLHIPDSMFVDASGLDKPTEKPQKKMSPLQLIILLASAFFILGILLAAQTYPDVHKMSYTLFGGVAKPPGINMDMVYAAFGAFTGNLIMSIAGILTGLHVKKRFSGGAVFLSVAGVASIGAMLLLIQLW